MLLVSELLTELRIRRRVEARVQALFEAVGNNPPERIRPCDLHKLVLPETKKGLRN
jgi:hypothetical protein